jgi:hypothetical protein
MDQKGAPHLFAGDGPRNALLHLAYHALQKGAAHLFAPF